jgi:hypothetical protein
MFAQKELMQLNVLDSASGAVVGLARVSPGNSCCEDLMFFPRLYV